MEEELFTNYYKLGEDIYIYKSIIITKYLGLNTDDIPLTICLHCVKKGDAVVCEEICFTPLDHNLFFNPFDIRKWNDVHNDGAQTSYDELKKIGILK